MRSERLGWIPPLLARGAMGIRFVAAGAGKLYFLAYHFDDVVRRSAGLSLSPIALRYGGGIISVVELVACTALVVGGRARSAAVALLGALGIYAVLEMVRVGGLVNRSMAFDFSVYGILLLWIAIAGPGPVTLGRWWLRRNPVRPRVELSV